jgi:hypothetical protein
VKLPMARSLAQTSEVQDLYLRWDSELHQSDPIRDPLHDHPVVEVVGGVVAVAEENRVAWAGFEYEGGDFALVNRLP